MIRSIFTWLRDELPAALLIFAILAFCAQDFLFALYKHASGPDALLVADSAACCPGTTTPDDGFLPFTDDQPPHQAPGDAQSGRGLALFNQHSND